MRLLLVSSSVVHGTGYLDHCEADVLDCFANVSSVLFVPYALFDRDGYAAKVRQRFEQFGLEMQSVHETDSPLDAVRNAEAFFTGGGNTFRLLDTLQRLELLPAIRERVENGAPYMGTSAGSNIAGPTIRTTNDMPIVEPSSFEALGLVDFQLNPHYIDADPESTHKGETRDQRLAEYLEENETPVVAIREGALIRARGSEATIGGSRGGKLFRRGQEVLELRTGDRVS